MVAKEKLLEDLQSKDWRVRIEAYRKLGEAQLLGQALNDEELKQ